MMLLRLMRASSASAKTLACCRRPCSTTRLVESLVAERKEAADRIAAIEAEKAIRVARYHTMERAREGGK